MSILVYEHCIEYVSTCIAVGFSANFLSCHMGWIIVIYDERHILYGGNTYLIEICICGFFIHNFCSVSLNNGDLFSAFVASALNVLVN